MLSLRTSTLTGWVLAAGLLIGFGSLNPAKAVVVSGADFAVIETAGPGNTGYYTVINNSVSEYIYGFSVTNPFASGVNDWTTESGWIAGKTPVLWLSQDRLRLSDRPGGLDIFEGTSGFPRQFSDHRSGRELEQFLFRNGGTG
jgi:hypothetical protein